jgi:hypothetical protein
VNLDGVVIPTDRVKAPGPNNADLWWSGKHKHRAMTTDQATWQHHITRHQPAA